MNYLGALTSDVEFGSVRKTDNKDSRYEPASNTQTYYQWKQANIKNRTRNNGNSHNKLALASGVYLEITTEESTGPGLYEKVWGPITGVVELDLINVATGIGGGFVYAKNIHGVPTGPLSVTNATLTELNSGAVTKGRYTYTDPVTSSGTQNEWETSGNFVHSKQTIIDDCYNISNKYAGEVNPDGTGAMPAHYWYIKGSVYVYDQYISAYTGGANAFSEKVEMPLTIAAASHGKMKLLNVMPNRYAFYSSEGVELAEGKRVIINDKSYYKNDPISYWDWYLLSRSEKDLFVEKTYTNCITCKIDGVEYAAGAYVMTDGQFTDFKKESHTYTDAEGETIEKGDKTPADDDYIFRESNNVAHGEGYILTYQVNNPSIWDQWYTPKTTTETVSYRDKLSLAEYSALTSESTLKKSDYYDGPTYRLDPDKLDGEDGKVLGQSSFKEGDLIPKSVEDTYKAITNKPSTGQATFVPAYIVTSKFSVTDGTGKEHQYYPGTAISKTLADAHSGNAAEAYICTKSIQLTKEDVLYKDTRMTKTEALKYSTDVTDEMDRILSGADEMTVEAIKALPTTGEGAVTAANKKTLIDLAFVRDDLTAYLVPAYYCTGEGLYGGNYYLKGNNYRALEAWSSMSEDDRQNFIFNYDALDLLIDPSYSNAEGKKYQYDGKDYESEEDVKKADTGNKAGYSIIQGVDYTASYNSDTVSPTLTNAVTVKRNGKIKSDVTELINGDELSREEFEDKLINEKRHYSAIAVTDAGKYYVVNTAFQIGNTPYVVGETISESTYSGLTNKSDVTELTFSEGNKTYYYCRENYTPKTTVSPISSYGGGVAGAKGTLISKEDYDRLTNEQENFTIHGISPTEYSTLYVTRESDIYDLSKEKIITVIYQYDYEEVDGDNVVPVSERHVLNIHLQFKSGVPIVENIDKPDLILPGWKESMREPAVTPGAYEVTGGGWEIYESEGDAERHYNGVEYSPNNDKLYWYQDGYYVAYYARTYLGRTYSNSVPVSVGNYHDLADVMSDENKAHHMYIDHKDCQRAPKIYINDYTESRKNGLDIFKNLYDLSLVNATGDGYTVTDGKITGATGGANTNLVGHNTMNPRVKGANKLEFFMRTDIDYPDNPESDDWASIGTEAQCFEGTLHGDGHTISGLDHSLFNNLCGDVYNLGVTGSFNTAGVADKGSGYVESAWVKTTNDTPKGTKPYAVFGDPSDDKGYQVVNSYFYDGNKDLYQVVPDDGKYSYSKGSKGAVRAMTAQEFYNGTLAYDLNNFYLYKRYNDGVHTASGVDYKYWKQGTEELQLQTGYYASNADFCSSGWIDAQSNKIKYVEERFADGDFRYAGGTIPENEDERYHEEKETNASGEEVIVSTGFYPIWPDDYIFFGQKLTYGWSAQTHQNVPTAVVREEGRLSDGDDANRVYRAPAYYRNATMGMAHFNPHAYLAQTQKNVPETKAYPNMTAIDFNGHNDLSYQLGMNDGKFYTPLLDDDGLLSIQNCDETQNLMVYAPAGSGDEGYVNTQTFDVLTSYFTEPEYNEDNEDYRNVREASTGGVHGHLVQSSLEAVNDHLLVDKQDFNAPIAYNFDSNHLMWYQRIPSDNEYVDNTHMGWQGISIPFTAELVTTNTKGEITHFYSGSDESHNNTGTKKGHEYWLRQFKEGGTIDDGGTADVSDDVYKASFKYPDAGSDKKTVSNTFLWDYYYKNSSVHNQLDKNSDTYLQYRQYYKDKREYDKYGYLAAATPYILGLPGVTYYEFDLSGQFNPQTTGANYNYQLSKQVITFASKKHEHIGVSDNEKTGVTHDGYTFKPSYLNMELEAKEGTASYALNDKGNSYDKVTATTNVPAFRPFFFSGANVYNNSRSFRAKRIIFGGTDNDLRDGPETVLDGSLEIYTRGYNIVTTSYMKEATVISIITAAGAIITNYVLQPGETIETTVPNTGVYVVNKKKVFVE